MFFYIFCMELNLIMNVFKISQYRHHYKIKLTSRFCGRICQLVVWRSSIGIITHIQIILASTRTHVGSNNWKPFNGRLSSLFHQLILTNVVQYVNDNILAIESKVPCCYSQYQTKIENWTELQINFSNNVNCLLFSNMNQCNQKLQVLTRIYVLYSLFNCYINIEHRILHFFTIIMEFT